jgi:hypothetical protein
MMSLGSIAAWCANAMLALAILIGASPARAEPLDYEVAQTFLGRVLVDANVEVQYTPPVGPALSQYLIASTDLRGQNFGSGVLDVGLPGNFDGGSQGLLLSAFNARTEFNDTTVLLTNVFDDLAADLPIPPPVPLIGAILLLDIGDLYVDLLGPLESPFLTLADPDVYYWAGVAPLQISSDVNLLLSIPGQQPVQFASTSFRLAASDGALVGTFDGDESLTALTVGVDEANVKPETDDYTAPFAVYAGPLGSITLRVSRLKLVMNGKYRAANKDYGLPAASPPASAPGCGVGAGRAALMPQFSWLRRRPRGGR